MKILTSLAFLILALVFTGCTTAEYQKMQHERTRLREIYEDARRKHFNAPTEIKHAVIDSVLGTWRLRSIEMKEGDVSEEILAATVALDASSRKNLTLRFYRDNTVPRYEGINGSIVISGPLTVGLRRIAEELYPLLILLRGQGLSPAEFLLEHSAAELYPRIVNLPLSISVDGDRLLLTLDGGMTLTPDGWAQRGGIRCAFQRMKEE